MTGRNALLQFQKAKVLRKRLFLKRLSRLRSGFAPGPRSGVLAIFLPLFLLARCATGPPSVEQVDDLCELYRGYPKWYRSARKSSQRWEVPIPVLMAIIHQESRFRAEARPPRKKFLWIFPGPRPSSAFGYAQAADVTWQEYQRSTGRGGAERDDFGDAVDFVGWYCHMSSTRCGIPKNDARDLYLAYHEGHGGFNRKTYRRKAWLRRVAFKVEQRAKTYDRQLTACEKEFQKRPGSCLWPFW